jgi:hypothetical protein
MIISIMLVFSVAANMLLLSPFGLVAASVISSIAEIAVAAGIVFVSRDRLIAVSDAGAVDG